MSWTSTLSAPSSAAESTGVTTRSKRDRTVAQAGPSGVSSPALSRRSRSLPGTSCSQAVGQPPANSRPSAAWLVPWCGEPRVSTRRARAAPPWSRTQSRATTPPAE